AVEMEDVNFSFSDLVTELDATEQAEEKQEETPAVTDESEAPTAVFDAVTAETGETGETEEIQEESEAETAYSPEVSYTGFIADEDQSGEEEIPSDVAEEEGVEEPAEAIGEYELDVEQEETEGEKATGLSYADLIADEDVSEKQPAESEEVVLEFDEGQDETAATGEYLQEISEEEVVLDEADLTLDEGEEELTLESEDMDIETEEEEAKPAEEEEGIFVSGGDMDDEVTQEDDFLGLEDAGKKEDDSFLGVSIKEHTLPEIMLEGIEMDAEEQTKLVTQAEVFLAQGKTEDAEKIYAQLAEEGGVTPFVSKRLKQFNIGKPKDEPVVDEETVVEVETEEPAGEA
ncbi:hypothetical protein ACFL55_02205, partial [Candidatus Latescibacterota bacterium]